MYLRLIATMQVGLAVVMLQAASCKATNHATELEPASGTTIERSTAEPASTEGSLAGAEGSQCLARGWSGVWLHTADGQEQQQRRKAIEVATQDMSTLFRGTARKRLDERTAPPRELTLAVEGDRLELSRDGNTIALRLGAKPVTVESNGQRGALSARCDGDRIIVKAKGDGGGRLTTYTLSPDGRQLMLSVRVINERLAGPLSFHSSFRRK